MKVDFSQNMNSQFLGDALGVVKYPLDTTIEWIQNNLEPEEVFDEATLKSWAKNNGFVEEEGCPTNTKKQSTN